MNKSSKKSVTNFVLSALIVIMIAIVLLVMIKRSNQSHSPSQKHKSALNGIQVAIEHVNSRLLTPATTLATGIGWQAINSVDVEVLNGQLRANETSLRQGLNLAYDAGHTHHAAFEHWQLLRLSHNPSDPARIKIRAINANENCHLIYTEAGMNDEYQPVQYQIVDHGC